MFPFLTWPAGRSAVKHMLFQIKTLLSGHSGHERKHYPPTTTTPGLERKQVDLLLKAPTTAPFRQIREETSPGPPSKLLTSRGSQAQTRTFRTESKYTSRLWAAGRRRRSAGVFFSGALHRGGITEGIGAPVAARRRSGSTPRKIATGYTPKVDLAGPTREDLTANRDLV